MGLSPQALAVFAVLAAATVDAASVGAPMRLRGGAPKKAGPPTRADWIKKAESMKVSEGARLLTNAGGYGACIAYVRSLVLTRSVPILAGGILVLSPAHR